MGSSAADPNNSNSKAVIDASVGGLVWVRRRNGSWWPGRIMGLDEISEGSLVSPRSGTPVKLLGREDASVDWYNLEKSKRVKAFRCGEYDECIEKARASVAFGNKKVVKYARREDAILHALEIENDLLGKGHLDSSRTNGSGGLHESSAKESPSMSLSGKEDEDRTDEETKSNDTEDTADPGSEPDSAPELSQSGISFEDPNHIGALKAQPVQEKRRKTPNDSEDDGTEGIKRMRGLEDLGMGVGDSTGSCMSNGGHVTGNKGYKSSLKRKRSQVAHVQEFLKRKNRRRPLTKVLESTAMVSIPVVCDQLPTSGGSPLHGFSDSKVSGIESNESRKSFSAVVNNNSDSTGVSCENGTSLNPSEHADDVFHACHKLKENDISGAAVLAKNDASDRLFDVPFIAEEKRTTGLSPVFVSSSTERQHVGGLGGQSSPNSQAETVPLKHEGFIECGSTSSAATHVNNISQRMDKGTSKWQFKRKRNSRHIGKHRKQGSRKNLDMDDEPNAYLAGKDQMDGFVQDSDDKVDYDGNRSSLTSYNCSLQMESKPFAEGQVDGVEEWSKYISLRECHINGQTMDVSLPPQRSLPFRQSRFTINSKYQTSYFPGRIFCSNSKLYDVKLDVRADYRPQHVPLVSLMSKLNGKAIVGHPLTVEPLNDGFCDSLTNSYKFSTNHVPVFEAAELGYDPLRHSQVGRFPAKHMRARTSSRKSPKSKKNGFLPKKIRKLSSIGNKQEDRKAVLEKLKGPVIACIPLRLVFSRMNEAVNGSARPTHRALTPSNS